MRPNALAPLVGLALLAPLCAAGTQSASEVKLLAPGLPESDRMQVLQKLQHTPYASPEALSVELFRIVRDLGYVKASPASIVSPPSSALVISITPGPQYHFTGFTVRGNHSLSPQQLAAAYALRPGDLVSPSLIGKTLGNLLMAYQHAGRQQDVISPLLLIDETTHTMAVELQINEDRSSTSSLNP